MGNSAKFRIPGREAEYTLRWLLTTPAGQGFLAKARDQQLRLLCMCKPQGVPMYVSKRDGKYALCRMPNGADEHAPDCRSHEATSVSQVERVAPNDKVVQALPNAGDAEPVEFEFSGAITYGKSALSQDWTGTTRIVFGDDEARDFDGLRSCVSIDGLLDLLLDVSELNRFTPPEPQKRNWISVRERIRQAAEQIHDGANAVAETLSLPEKFDPEHAAAQRAIMETEMKRPGRQLLCAPLKEVQQTHYGFRLAFKNMPGTPFWISRAKMERALKHSPSLTIEKLQNGYSIALAQVVEAKERGFRIESFAVRMTDRNWFPLITSQDETACDWLCEHQVAFVRPLRYDAPPNLALVDFALLQQGGRPTPMMVDVQADDHMLDASRSRLVRALRAKRVKGYLWAHGGWQDEPPTADKMGQK